MGAFADKQAPLRRDTLLFQFVEFCEQGFRFENHTVPDDARLVRMDNTCRYEVEDELEVTHLDRVPCVRASLVSDDDIGIGRQEVDDFGFSFIAPLGAQYNSNRHDKTFGTTEDAEDTEGIDQISGIAQPP